MSWQNYPFIRLIIPFVFGMVGANFLIEHLSMNTLFILSCAMLAVLFFVLPKRETVCRNTIFSIGAMTFAFLVGMTLYTRAYQRIEKGIPQDCTFCQGTLSEPPTEKAKSWALNLKQENGIHILLYIGKSHANDSLTFVKLNIGDTIFATPKHLNPTTQVADSIFQSYYNSLFNNGICATAYAAPNQWTVHPCRQTAHPFHSLRSLQEKMHRIYTDNGISGDTGSIIEAMTIGYKANLSKDVRTHYAASGVSHILAMSGFHVGIIAFLLRFVFFITIIPFRWQWLCNLLIIIALWCFATIAGLSPSIVRATLMFTILLLCQSFSHELLSINSCGLALFIMLCINPLSIHHIGFQLSFLSVLGICIFGVSLIHLLQCRRISFRILWEMMAISFTCTLFTAPLTAYYFGYMPMLSLISNLAITPFVYLIIAGSVFWWAFLWYPPVHHLLTDSLNWASQAMNRITEYISSLPFASIEWHPSLFTAISCYVPLLIIAFILKKHETRRTMG